MKNFVNDFYANEHKMASDKYLNAIGDEFDAVGSDFDANGNEFSNAGTKRASLPYIVKIANGTTADITNIPIFYANKYARTTGVLPAGVTYTVTNFDSYDTFLFQTLYKKFVIGRTYWTSSSATQVTDITFNVKNRDADGRELTTPIVPIFDKYANQDKVNDSDTPYVVDGNTEIVLSNLYASATITIHFYPSETVNDKGELSGRSGKTSYGDPYQMGLMVRR